MMATKPSVAHVVPESHSIAQMLQALIALIRNGIRKGTCATRPVLGAKEKG